MSAPYSHLISWKIKNQFKKNKLTNLYAFVNVHGWYYNLVNLLPIEDKLNVMRIMCKLGS